jgi:hypothetical protein
MIQELNSKKIDLFLSGFQHHIIRYNNYYLICKTMKPGERSTLVNVILTVLRSLIGWHFLYEGLVKIF